MKKSVLLIGSGLGSLATALRLTKHGYDVQIVEKFSTPGGRLNLIEKDGFSFDMGPSFFSMSYEFKELFDYIGIESPLQLNELNPLYAVYFEGKDHPFLMHKDLKKLAKEFENVEPHLEQKVKKYLDAAGKLFHDTENIVVKQNFDSKLNYLLQLTRVPFKHGPKMFRSMWSELEKNFDSEEVKVIFSLVSFFLGSTPFQTPAVYSLLNYTELVHDGYWNVQGGMYKIVTEIIKILESKGVKFTFNTEIVSLEEKNGMAVAAIDSNGKRYEADIIVCNADAASFRGKVLKRREYNEPKLDKMDWTLSPFTIYLGVKGKLENLHHHNYFLGNNFREYADKIFKTSVSPKKPYYYVNVSSRSNPGCAPEGHENLFILCPVPDLRYKPDWSDSEELANTIIKDLSERVGYDISSNIVSKTILSPVEWQNNFNLYRGSGLGLAHGLNQIGGFRPANKDEKLSNLYYVGASTIPGTGLPIVVIGSRLVTERILNDHGTIQ